MAVIPSLAYETKLQERLSAPTVWKELCNVKYTNTGIIRNPYLTDATVATGTRGTGYTSVAIATVDETVSVTDYTYSAEHIDDADLAQKSFSDFMEIADNMGTMLDEGMETAMLLEHAQWTNLGDVGSGALGAGSTTITVSISNIKAMIAAVKQIIRTAGGGTLADRNGIFIQWREADYTLVELLASSEGFNTADDALKNGIKQGFKYLNVENYSTSKNVTNHVFAGVKKAFNVYVVKDTYGKMKTIINPVVSGAQISGVGLESRIDRKFKAWAKMVPVLFDINVV
jgi:hypothetical protein